MPHLASLATVPDLQARTDVQLTIPRPDETKAVRRADVATSDR